MFPDPGRSGFSMRCVGLLCGLDTCEVVVLEEPGLSAFVTICTLRGLDNCELVVLEDPALSNRVIGTSGDFSASNLGAFADPGRSNRLTPTAWGRVGLVTGLDNFDGDSGGGGWCLKSGNGAEVSVGRVNTVDWSAGT